MDLAFKSRFTGEMEERLVYDYPDFILSAYDTGVQWSGENNAIPAKNENDFWLRSEKTPEIGERRIVWVERPFVQTVGDEFWTQYQHACSCFNGWGEYPEEIDSSAFIKCRLHDVLSRDEYEAWIEVEVVALYNLNEVLNNIPQKPGSSFFDTIHIFEGYDVVSYNDWIYYSGQDQGDLGNWILMRKVLSEIHLIAYGEWNFSRSAAYLGNLVLDKRARKKLFEVLEKAG